MCGFSNIEDWGEGDGPDLDRLELDLRVIEETRPGDWKKRGLTYYSKRKTSLTPRMNLSLLILRLVEYQGQGSTPWLSRLGLYLRILEETHPVNVSWREDNLT